MLGMPRRVVTYPVNLQTLNDWVSISAYVLGLSMLVFFVNLIYSMLIKREPLVGNPWDSRSVEWQLPTPVPLHDFDRFPTFDDDAYPYGVEPAGAPAPALAGGE
jgi:cytochrome c oxidase subunit 1